MKGNRLPVSGTGCQTESQKYLQLLFCEKIPKLLKTQQPLKLEKQKAQIWNP
jgi:hypothetical protein